MTNVIRLARDPLSTTECVVMYATAVVGASPDELPSVTGLAAETVEEALAGLVRRGLIRPAVREVRRTLNDPSGSARRLRLTERRPLDPHTPSRPAA